MRTNLLLALAGCVLASCAQEPAVPPTAMGPPINYRVSGGFTGYGTLLEISPQGQATGWSLAGTRQLIGQRLLSQVELGELHRLLAPFPEYADSYGRVVADGARQRL